MIRTDQIRHVSKPLFLYEESLDEWKQTETNRCKKEVNWASTNIPDSVKFLTISNRLTNNTISLKNQYASSTKQKFSSVSYYWSQFFYNNHTKLFPWELEAVWRNIPTTLMDLETRSLPKTKDFVMLGVKPQDMTALSIDYVIKI